MRNLFEIENMDETKCRLLNPQILAFVGDGVYSLFVRNHLVSNTNTKGNALHKLTVEVVKAKAQSETINKLISEFNEVELSVFKRARNHKTNSMAKNASAVEYKRATGLEAVIGYLYLIGNFERLNWILEECINEDRGQK